MKKIIALIIMAGLLALLTLSCDTGDDADPGVAKKFRFVCDTSTELSECEIPNTRILTWKAGGDDGDSGQAIDYDLRYSKKPMSSDVYEGAKELYNEPEPEESGVREIVFLPRLLPGTPISFGLRSRDEVSRESPLAKTPLVTLGFIGTSLNFYRECADSIDNDGDTLVDTDDADCASGLDGSEQYTAPVVPDPRYGAVTTLLSDVSDDGRRDVAVGAPGAISSFNGEDTGSVSLFFSLSKKHIIVKDGHLKKAADSMPPAVVIYGDVSGDGFGASIDGEADFNNDGEYDFVVGAPGADRVYIFFGGNSGKLKLKKLPKKPTTPLEISASDAADVIITGPAGSSFGTAAVLLGKMNGRSGSELAVGAPLENRVYLFYGGFKLGNALEDDSVLPVLLDMNAAGWADWTFEGPAGSDFGRVLSRITDIDDIGKDELAVGAPSIDSVFVFYGGTRIGKAIDFTLTGPQTWTYNGTNYDLLIQGPVGSEFGAALGNRGIPSGEDVGSIAVGAPGEDKVYVVHGGDFGVILFPTVGVVLHDVATQGADWVLEGETGTRFGEAVSIRSDLDDNSYYDILVGAPDSIRPGGTQVGAVYAFYSHKNTNAVRTYENSDAVIWGKIDGGRFGASIAGLLEQITHRDLTYRDYDDFVAGAPDADEAYIEF